MIIELMSFKSIFPPVSICLRDLRMISANNSFESSDDINQMDWDRKTQFEQVFKFHKKLIAFRKAHPAFRLGSEEELNQHISFLKTPKENMIAYQISGNANGDEYSDILLVFNANREKTEFKLPSGTWNIALQSSWRDDNKTVKKTIDVPAIGSVILYKKGKG